MKKLLLVSSGLEYIKQFIGRDPHGMKMLFIPSAGNLDDDIWWIDKDRDVLTKMGFELHEADLAQINKEDLKNSVQSADIVYVAGGNTFYLLKVIRESGFDEVITQYVDGGGLYVGASAGAIVAGVDIQPITSLDEPEKVPELSSTKGLGLVNIVPVPHYDMADRTSKADDIKKDYGDQYEIVLMTDDQAIVVEGNEWKLVESKGVL